MRLEELASGYTVAGKYVIQRVLGRGGMGAVYLVAHAATGKRMAMKCMLPQLVHDAELVARFMREARVMGRVQHRHVVDVFDVGREGDLLFIVMELLEGKPLSELLCDDSVTLEDALSILLRAMKGVAAAHDHGVVHRDLKPDNIYVCEGASGKLDDPRVLDFGISKLEEPTGTQLTRTGIAMGTPHYMAIEQLNGQRDVDLRADVYAMGVILYEAISGTAPYPGDTPSAIAIRMLTTPPVDLARLRPDLPRGLTAAVMQAVARNRDDRPSSMRELIARLRPFLPQSAELAARVGGGLPLRTPRGGGSMHADVDPLPVAAFTPTSDQRPAAAAPASRRRAHVGVSLVLALGVAIELMTYLHETDASAPPAVPAVPQRVHELPAAAVEPTSTGIRKASEGAGANDAGAPTASAAAVTSSAPVPVDVPASPKGASSGVSPSRPTPWSRRKRLASSDRPAEPPVKIQADVPSDPPVTTEERSASGRAGVLGATEF